MKSLVKSRVSRDRLTGLIQNLFLFYACLDENVRNWREQDFCALACIGTQKREEAHVTIL